MFGAGRCGEVDVARVRPPNSGEHGEDERDDGGNWDAHSGRVAWTLAAGKRNLCDIIQTKRPDRQSGRGVSRKFVVRSLAGALHKEGALADTVTKVMKFCTTDFAAVGHFDFRNPRRVKWENALDAFTVGNFANGECSIHAGTTTCEDDASKNLDTLFATFNNAAMDLHGIADIEISDVLLQLLLLDLLNDMHGVLLLGK